MWPVSLIGLKHHLLLENIDVSKNLKVFKRQSLFQMHFSSKKLKDFRNLFMTINILAIEKLYKMSINNNHLIKYAVVRLFVIESFTVNVVYIKKY